MFESSAGGRGWGAVGCRPGVGAHWSGAQELRSTAAHCVQVSRQTRSTFTTLLLEAFFSASAIFLPDACLPRPRTRRFDRVSEFLLCREKENIIVAGLNEKDQTGFLRQQSKLKVSFQQ